MSNLRFWLLGCNSYGAASKIGSEETLQVGLTQTNLVLVGEAPGTCTKLHQRYFGIPQDIPHHILPWSFGESQLASWMNSMSPFLVLLFFFPDGFSPRVAGLSCAYWFVGHPSAEVFHVVVCWCKHIQNGNKKTPIKSWNGGTCHAVKALPNNSSTELA